MVSDSIGNAASLSLSIPYQKSKDELQCCNCTVNMSVGLVKMVGNDYTVLDKLKLCGRSNSVKLRQ